MAKELTSRALERMQSGTFYPVADDFLSSNHGKWMMLLVFDTAPAVDGDWEWSIRPSGGILATTRRSFAVIFWIMRIPVKLNSDSGICEHHFRKVCGQGFFEQKRIGVHASRNQRSF